VKNVNKLLLALSIFSVLFGIGSYWEKNSFPYDKGFVAAECGCYCHKLHLLEEKKMLAQLREERDRLQEEKGLESVRKMKEQEEYCSRPFREYL